jgi:hypothetical protein
MKAIRERFRVLISELVQALHEHRKYAERGTARPEHESSPQRGSREQLTFTNMTNLGD